MKKKSREHKTKRQLFEQTCVDTKDLCDVFGLWAPAQALGLPRYQYTVW